MALEWVTTHYPKQKTIIDIEGFSCNSMVYWTNTLKYGHYVAIEPTYEDYKQLIKNLGKCVKSFVSMYNVPLGIDRKLDEFKFSDVTLIRFGNGSHTHAMIEGSLDTIVYWQPIVITQERIPELEKVGYVLIRKGLSFIYLPQKLSNDTQRSQLIDSADALGISG